MSRFHAVRPAVPSRRDLIVLASTRALAMRAAEVRGVPANLVLWPRKTQDLKGYDYVPIWVDKSFWDHPRAEDLADWLEERLRHFERVKARQTTLARIASSPLN